MNLVTILAVSVLALAASSLSLAADGAGEPAISRLLVRNADGSWSFPTVSAGGREWNVGAFDFSYAGYHYGEREEFVGIPDVVRRIEANEGEDISEKLNEALAALPDGGVVEIPVGTFRIGTDSRTVQITNDNTMIRGAGMGRTILQVDRTYHAAEQPNRRQSATWSSGVINFLKPGDQLAWHYNRRVDTVVTQPIALGARTITVEDAAAISVGDEVVIRQMMWEEFVRKNAYDESKAPQPLRWVHYGDNGELKFTDAGNALTYLRKVLAIEGNVLTLDVPIAHELDPANMRITVGRLETPMLRNCGMEELTITAEEEEGAAPESSIGTTLMIKGLVNGLFRNVEIASFRTIAFGTAYPVNVSFINCTAANAINCGGGGSGYGFYIRGQNLLYRDCTASNLRHGYTTAAPQTSNIVIKDCRSLDYRFNTGLLGEFVDDTHTKYSHAILWDNHYSKDAGLLMINRGTLSGNAYETCGWGIVWNYRSAGFNTREAPRNHDSRRNFVGVTPAEFGVVVGVHSTGEGPDGVRVHDGYSRRSGTEWGKPVDTPDLQVGPVSGRVLYEYIGRPVAGSIYQAQFSQRQKLVK